MKQYTHPANQSSESGPCPVDPIMSLANKSDDRAKPSEVMEAFEYLFKTASTLTSLVSVIEVKFAPVLREPGKCAERAAGDKAPSYSVPIAATVAEVNGTLVNLVARLEDVLRRNAL